MPMLPEKIKMMNEKFDEFSDNPDRYYLGADGCFWTHAASIIGGQAIGCDIHTDLNLDIDNLIRHLEYNKPSTFEYKGWDIVKKKVIEVSQQLCDAELDKIQKAINEDKRFKMLPIGRDKTLIGKPDVRELAKLIDGEVTLSSLCQVIHQETKMDMTKLEREWSDALGLTLPPELRISKEGRGR